MMSPSSWLAQHPKFFVNENPISKCLVEMELWLINQWPKKDVPVTPKKLLQKHPVTYNSAGGKHIVPNF